MRFSQQVIYELMDYAGLPVPAEGLLGVCQGITRSASIAALRGERHTHQSRLQQHEFDWRNYRDNKIYEQLYRHESVTVRSDQDAYMQGVYLYQSVGLNKELFTPGISLQQHDDPAYHLLDEHDPDAYSKILTDIGLFNRSELQTMLQSFRSGFANLSCAHSNDKTDGVFSIEFGALGHAIHLSFDPISREWWLLDPNELSGKAYTIDQERHLVNKIFMRYMLIDPATYRYHLLLKTTALVNTRSEFEFRRRLPILQSSEAWQSIHRVSFKKAHHVNWPNGEMLQHIAAVHDNVDILDSIAAQPGFNVNRQMKDGRNALSEAITIGSMHTFRWLITRSDIDIYMNVGDEEKKYTALFAAIGHDRLECMQLLMKHAHSDEAYQRLKADIDPVYVALQHDSIHCLQYMLRNNLYDAKAQLADEKNLVLAVVCGSYRCAQLLLLKHCYMHHSEIKSDLLGKLLYHAVCNGDVKMFNLLFDLFDPKGDKAEGDYRQLRWVKSYLCEASYRGHIDMIARLLQIEFIRRRSHYYSLVTPHQMPSNSDNPTEDQGKVYRSAVAHAVIERRSEVVKYLLEHNVLAKKEERLLSQDIDEASRQLLLEKCADSQLNYEISQIKSAQLRQQLQLIKSKQNHTEILQTALQHGLYDIARLLIRNYDYYAVNVNAISSPMHATCMDCVSEDNTESGMEIKQMLRRIGAKTYSEISPFRLSALRQLLAQTHSHRLGSATLFSLSSNGMKQIADFISHCHNEVIEGDELQLLYAIVCARARRLERQPARNYFQKPYDHTNQMYWQLMIKLHEIDPSRFDLKAMLPRVRNNQGRLSHHYLSGVEISQDTLVLPSAGQPQFYSRQYLLKNYKSRGDSDILIGKDYDQLPVYLESSDVTELVSEHAEFRDIATKQQEHLNKQWIKGPTVVLASYRQQLSRAVAKPRTIEHLSDFDHQDLAPQPESGLSDGYENICHNDRQFDGAVMGSVTF